MTVRSGQKPVVVFDGDDTLWETQAIYDSAKAEFYSLLEQLGHSREAVESTFGKIDVANVARLGFSRRRFPTSMRETYEHFCRSVGGEPEPEIIGQVTRCGEAVFDTVPAVREGARGVLSCLRPFYRLILFTAGDEEVQNTRIAQTGLRDSFDDIYITPHKSGDSWTGMLQAEGVLASTAWSVGNSVRSDINPALEAGLRCVLIARDTWEYEKATLSIAPDDGRISHTESLVDAARIILKADGLWLTPGSTESVLKQLREVRRTLQNAFAPDTAFQGTEWHTPSAGHCAAVAAIVQKRFGGALVSTQLQGQSHWFNRLIVEDEVVDVDLTGDQFGLPFLQMAPAGQLYPSVLLRDSASLLPETLERAALLARRARINDVSDEIVEEIAARTSGSSEILAKERSTQEGR